jgi:DNA (cytosine-5)-methyltransferase 1
MLTLGSLFDGIGGWQIAAIRAGAAVLWSSEIEPFPCAVTKKHFPETVQLGDITKIDGERLWPVDIICAGSPCQDLSIAGKQEGLKGARSGLFRTAIRLVRDMRRASGGRFPRFFVWENVPGAFSSNHGMDFLAVLEEIGEATLPMPDGGRWAQAGMVELPSCQIAWRVLDAQYWGVPQRRKRIFLVADFRGHSAGEILFERESVRGDSSESGEKRERASVGTESGVGSASVLRMRQGCAGGGKGPLISQEKSLTLATGNDQTLFVPDKARALTARNDGSPCVDRGPDIIAAGFKAGAGAEAGGLGYQVEQMPTLTSAESGTQRPTVAVYGVGVENGKAGTLDASYYKGQGERQGTERTAVAVYDMTHADEVMRPVDGGKCQTLNARMGTGWNQVPVLAYTQQAFGQYEETGKASAIKARDYKDATDLCVQKSVRRLTPTECERLQGLPDGYTLIDDKTCSDTARYKALGNGMAQPCADYVIRRIVEVCDVGAKETDGGAD